MMHTTRALPRKSPECAAIKPLHNTKTIPSIRYSSTSFRGRVEARAGGQMRLSAPPSAAPRCTPTAQLRSPLLARPARAVSEANELVGGSGMVAWLMSQLCCPGAAVSCSVVVKAPRRSKACRSSSSDQPRPISKRSPPPPPPPPPPNRHANPPPEPLHHRPRPAPLPRPPGLQVEPVPGSKGRDPGHPRHPRRVCKGLRKVRVHARGRRDGVPRVGARGAGGAADRGLLGVGAGGDGEGGVWGVVGDAA